MRLRLSWQAEDRGKVPGLFSRPTSVEAPKYQENKPGTFSPFTAAS
jgi:hypothetical protein